MSNEQLVVQGLVHAKLYLDASAAAALLASGCRRTQDANAGAELRRKAALPQLRGVHLADGCMYVQPPCVEAYGGVTVPVGVECSGKRGWQPGSSWKCGTQRDGGDVLAGVVTFSVCSRGTKDYNLRVLINESFLERGKIAQRV